MSIEEIEKALSSLDKYVGDEVPPAALLPVMQCQLLFAIYKKLEAIEQKLEVPSLTDLTQRSVTYSRKRAY